MAKSKPTSLLAKLKIKKKQGTITKAEEKKLKQLMIAAANNIRSIQTRPDPREGLRKNIDPKRYHNPDSPDGRWPRRMA